MVYINYSLLISIAVLVLCTGFSNCANILGIFHCGSRSHHILGEVLLKELARRGHNVTMASPFPLKEKVVNYTDVHLTEILKEQKAREHLFLSLNKNPLATLEVLNMTLTQTELTLTDKNMENLVKSGTKFDLIVVDWFLSHAFLIYADIFNAPVIIMCSNGPAMASEVTGNPFPPSFVSHALPYPDHMSFLQRTANTLLYLTFKVMECLTIGRQESMLRNHFTNPPSYDKLRDRVALALSNSHYSFESGRPYVPNVVPVGGFHVEKPKALPNDLKKIIDEAEHGVIYFSLGSTIQSKTLPKEVQQHIIKAFSQVKQIVLWKWEDEKIPDLPKNVVVRKWLPQNDILAHPNVKLFITHGGLLSTIETIYHGKPIIGIPIFADQQANIFKAIAQGYAVQVDLAELTEETLLAAIKKIIDNSTYAENVKRRSSLLRDQPVSPMDKAVFWVEHVIKHKGAPHLRNAGVDLPWYQYFLLDVIAFIVAVVSLILMVLYFCNKKIYQLLKYLWFRKIKKD